MKPILNNPIPPDLNTWLTVFPGLKVAYLQLLDDVAAGKPIVPETYYKLAVEKNQTGHHPGILAIRMAVFIWVQTGILDPETFAGHYWSHGDKLVAAASENNKSEIPKTALVIVGTDKNQPGALIYVIEDKVLRWETAGDEWKVEK